MKYLRKYESPDLVQTRTGNRVSWMRGNAFGGKVPGFGLDKYTDKLPKGMSQSQYRNKKTKFKYTTESFYLFTENADSIEVEVDGEHIYTDVDAGIPFAWFEPGGGHLIVGKPGTTHMDNGIEYPHWDGYEDCGFNHHGRLWLEHKLMSFWNYPPAPLFKKMIDGLEKNLKKKFWNEGWRVEILEKADGKIYTGYDPDENQEYRDDFDLVLIPIEKYLGSKDVPREQLELHLMSAEEKRKALIDMGYKPKNLKTPKGMSQAQYRNKKTKYKFTENMKSFDKFTNENMFDKAKKTKKEKPKTEQTDFKIYVDLDGVLCDFNKQLKVSWLDKYNKENGTKFKDGWSFEEKVGKKEFWSKVGEVGLTFWSDMPWMPDGKKLWNFIKDKNTEILSTPSKDKISRDGKKIWCERELDDVKLNLSYQKQTFANPKSILIDDLKKNIDKWTKAGGIGILHKNTEDTIKKIKEILDEKL